MQNNTFYLKIIFLISLFFLYEKSDGQNQSSAIGVLGGYAQEGVAGLINYNYYIGREDFIQTGVYLSFNKDKIRSIEVPYNIFTLNIGYFRSILSSRRNSFNINLGGGVVAGYEVINNGSDTLDNGALILDKSQFIYGAFGSVELDVIISDQWSFILKLNEYYHVNSDLGELTPFAGAGLRYFLF